MLEVFQRMNKERVLTKISLVCPADSRICTLGLLTGCVSAAVKKAMKRLTG